MKGLEQLLGGNRIGSSVKRTIIPTCVQWRNSHRCLFVASHWHGTRVYCSWVDSCTIFFLF